MRNPLIWAASVLCLVVAAAVFVVVLLPRIQAAQPYERPEQREATASEVADLEACYERVESQMQLSMCYAAFVTYPQDVLDRGEALNRALPFNITPASSNG